MASLEQKIKYRNDLTTLVNNLSIDQAICDKLSYIDRIHREYNFEDYDKIVQNYKSLAANNECIIDIIRQKITNTTDEITNIVNERHKNIDPMIDIKPNSHLNINAEIELKLLSKIRLYSQFKYPGLQLNCNFSQNTIQWLNAMVTNDPFYLAGLPDEYGEIRYLEDMIKPYPEIYQKRVRLYTVNNRDLSVLPQAQFGLILCWNFFNYQTLDTIEIYLTKIIKLLRPGGILIFSYNNCDILESARLFDNYHGEWATSKLLEKIYLLQGFELIEANNFQFDTISCCSWVELKRPGHLTTVKLSQAQGLVARK